MPAGSDHPIRVAMWSGPRNISTALMRSWGQRPDTAVCDEPLYAHYLHATGLDHPGAAEVIAAGPADWREAVAFLLGPVPGGRRVFYQKHMAHHLLPNIEREWIHPLSNAFLIREPREMITSLAKILPHPDAAATGLPQQVELFEWVRESTGATPPVIDARDVLDDPRGVLGALCDSLGLAFTDAMLSWPPGRRDTDGVWAKYWYDGVERSTTFQPHAPKAEPVPDRLLGLLDECEGYYAALHAHRLRGS
jgi:hypothetical protein